MDDAAAAIEKGRLLFAGSCDFVWGAESQDQLPPSGLPEVAFAGRSNVGKSSLVNALTGRKTLARVSHTPGRTQQINFFDLGERMLLVDLPGYGHAEVSKKQKQNWGRLIHDYLKGRVTLSAVCLLIDSRHGLKDLDKEIMQLLDKAAVSYRVILTKADKTKKDELYAVIQSTTAALKKHTAAYPQVFVTSSHDVKGIEELRAEIAAFAHD